MRWPSDMSICPVSPQKSPLQRFFHSKGKLEIQIAKAVHVMRYQINRNSLVHVTPLGVMIKFFGMSATRVMKANASTKSAKTKSLCSFPF